MSKATANTLPKQQPTHYLSTKTTHSLIIGPCSAESSSQMEELVRALSGKIQSASCLAHDLTPDTHFRFDHCLLRAGLWKPRSNPDSFQGVGAEGLPWLVRAAAALGISPVTEVAQPEHLRLAYQAGLRHFWVGARTTANPFQVDALAETALALDATGEDLHWYIKNPPMPDIELWCGAIERFRKAGQHHLSAIHRGFSLGNRSLSPYRNEPVWSIPIECKRRYPQMPIIVDASHIAGKSDLVTDIATRAIHIGFDGLMIEVHPNPSQALSDAQQQLTPDGLFHLLDAIQAPATPKTENAHDNEEMELLALREQIDETDNALWALIEKRLLIAQQIGEYKHRRHLPILQTERFNSIMQERLQWAAAHGIRPDTAKQILTLIHEESVMRQL